MQCGAISVRLFLPSVCLGLEHALFYTGFYPVAGQDTYLLNRPYFPKITIRNAATGVRAIIIASGLSPQNKYIQSATLNGVAYTKNWISHDLFRYGGTLRFVMGASRESKWGTGEEDLPMSLSTGGFACEGECGPGKGHGANSNSNGTVVGEPGDIDAVKAGDTVVDGSEDGPGGVKSFFSYLVFLLLAD
jgi:hypothetical protein